MEEEFVKHEVEKLDEWAGGFFSGLVAASIGWLLIWWAIREPLL